MPSMGTMPGQYQQYNPKSGEPKHGKKKYWDDVNKRAKKQQDDLRKEAQKQLQVLQPTQANIPTQVAETPQQANARIAQAIAERHQRENEAATKAGLDMRTRLQNAQGFSPEQARAMQYEAHKGIQRQEQGAQRNLVGAQGVQGIGGRSGIGYAQRRDLNRGYAAQHGQAQRDFNRLNAEQGMANVGAEYAAEQGEKSRLGTDWETELEREERKKYREANPNYAKEAYQQFSRM